MLSSATKNDSGEYKMEKHASDGVLLHKIIVELDVLGKTTIPIFFRKYMCNRYNAYDMGLL